MAFGTVAVNGEVRRLEDLRLQDFFQCFQFGAGFFETLLVTGGAPMFLERHLARLRASLQTFPMAVKAPPEETLTPEAVREALRRCLEADAELGPGFTGVCKLVAGDGRLLVMFRPGPGERERQHVGERPIAELEERTYRRGDRTLNHKSLAYFRQRVEQERLSLFCNERGEACETPTANLFVLLGDTLVTPPLDAPCLPGIVRGVLLEAGRVGTFPVEERPVTRAELGSARGGFVTNSVYLAQPVTRILERPLPASPGLASMARDVIQSVAKRG